MKGFLAYPILLLLFGFPSFASFAQVSTPDAYTNAEGLYQARLYGEIISRVKTDYVRPVEIGVLVDNAIRAMWKTVGITAAIPKTTSDQLSEAGTKNGDGLTSADITALKKFVLAYAEIRKRYEAVDGNELMDSAIRGTLSGLDSHSAYFNPSEFNDLKIGITGQRGSLGITGRIENDFFKIISVFEDSPAARAKLKPGDLIINLDDKSAKGITLNEMRGKPGTDINLTIVREEEPMPLIFKITREIVHVKNVKIRMLEPGFGYVRITNLQRSTTSDLLKAISDLQKEATLEGLILDLRNNPGGVLTGAVKVSDAFINNGLIVYTEGRMADSSHRYVATHSDSLNGAPLVVLVNGGTAAGAEIVATALQYHGRAVIVGNSTIGQGSIQTIQEMRNGDAIKLTTAYFFSPSGRRIQDQGVIPNLCVWNDQGEVVERDQAQGARNECPKKTSFYQEGEADIEIRIGLQILKDPPRYRILLRKP